MYPPTDAEAAASPAGKLFAPTVLVLIATCLVAAAPELQARSSDRDQPMTIDAGDFDGIVADSAVTRYRDDVHIVQGSLDIRADTADITTRDGEISRVVLNGSPATLRQVDDAGDPMEARASRIDYDLSGNSIVLTGSVRVEQPRGNLSGERVVYNLDTGQINAGGEGGRVRTVIQPANRGGG